MRLVTREESGARSCDTDETPPGKLCDSVFSKASVCARYAKVAHAPTERVHVFLRGIQQLPPAGNCLHWVGYRATRLEPLGGDVHLSAASANYATLTARHARTAAACAGEARAPRLVGASAASRASLSAARRGGSTSTDGPSATSSAEAKAGRLRCAARRSWPALRCLPPRSWHCAAKQLC